MIPGQAMIPCKYLLHSARMAEARPAGRNENGEGWEGWEILDFPYQIGGRGEGREYLSDASLSCFSSPHRLHLSVSREPELNCLTWDGMEGDGKPTRISTTAPYVVVGCTNR